MLLIALLLSLRCACATATAAPGIWHVACRNVDEEAFHIARRARVIWAVTVQIGVIQCEEPLLLAKGNTVTVRVHRMPMPAAQCSKPGGCSQSRDAACRSDNDAKSLLPRGDTASCWALSATLFCTKFLRHLCCCQSLATHLALREHSPSRQRCAILGQPTRKLVAAPSLLALTLSLMAKRLRVRGRLSVVTSNAARTHLRGLRAVLTGHPRKQSAAIGSHGSGARFCVRGTTTQGSSKVKEPFGESLSRTQVPKW